MTNSSMMVSWMFYSLFAGLLITIGAWIVSKAAARANVPVRWVWFGAIVLLTTLTLTAPWRSSIANELVINTALNAENPSLSAIDTNATSLGFSLAEALRILGSPWMKLSEKTGAIAPESTGMVLSLLWIITASVSLAILSTTLLRINAERRRWPKAQLLGRNIRLSTDRGPALYGVVDPDIVVPGTVLTLPHQEQALILLHEEEHKLAHDPAILMLSALAIASMPWNPASWWLAAKLRLSVETDCDRRVLNRGTAPREYGEMLVSCAGRLPARQSGIAALALFDSQSHLERRLIAMTDKTSRRTPARLITLSLAALTFTVVACSTDVPTSASIRDADASTVVTQLQLSPDAGISYTVDGKEVSKVEALAIEATDISTIEVVGVPAGSAPRDGGTRLNIVTGLQKIEGVAVAPQTNERRSDTPELTIIKGSPAASSDAKPLFILDGKEVESVNSVRPETIGSIEVLKSAAAVAKYGEKGRNGVIVITSK